MFNNLTSDPTQDILSSYVAVKEKLTCTEIVRTQFTWKIPSLSSLSKNSIKNYESCYFESGGYKWRLLLYPDGKPQLKDTEKYISLYLKVVDAEYLPTGWEVNVFPSLFLYNQIQDKFVTVLRGSGSGSGREGRMVRFHKEMAVWGYERFMPYSDFVDPSNGYLVEDTCTFGAEVHVCEPTKNSDIFTVMKHPTACSCSWKVERFSKLNDKHCNSTVFFHENSGSSWYMKLHPKGKGSTKGKFVSLYLYLKDTGSDVHDRIYVKFILRAMNHLSGQRDEFKDSKWFETNKGMGYKDFLELDILNHPRNGFLVGDTLTIEANITVIGLGVGQPKGIICSICGKTAEEETSSKCGHVFCKLCVMMAISNNDKCPNCEAILLAADLRRIYI